MLIRELLTYHYKNISLFEIVLILLVLRQEMVNLYNFYKSTPSLFLL